MLNAAPELNVTGYPLIKNNYEDPLNILSQYIEMEDLILLSNEIQNKLLKEIS